MKKFLSVLCLLTVFSCIFALMPPQAKAASTVSYGKKIVSVVYDDSGSMDDYNRYRYVYANYAMQTFCGLLSEQDELYITYMNRFSVKPQKINLSENSIQASVNEIRNYAITTGGTPYSSVTSAMNLLRSKTDANEKTEYYLVVITDGKFTGKPADSNENSITSFSETRMPNGTKPNVIYLGIGSDIEHLNLNKTNVKEYYATDEGNQTGSSEGVVAKMAEIANFVSHRSQVSSSDVKAVSDKRLEISSDVPLSNIAALVQGSGAKVIGVTHKESGKHLNVSRNVSSYWSTSDSQWSHLSGQSVLIKSETENIPGGTYVLDFDSAVSKDDVLLLLEPALELRLSITCNGREIDKLAELDKLRERDKITVSYDVYEYGTNNKVLLSDLPQGTTASLSVSENGTVKQTVTDLQNVIHHYSLSRSKTEFKASLKIPGFNAIETFIDFTPLKYVEYSVKAEYGSGIDTVKLKDISKQHGLSLVFTLYADGVAVTDPNEVRAFAPKVTPSPEGNAGTVTVRNDGKIVFTPNAAPATGYTNHKLTVTALCEINGVSASATYFVTEPVYTVKAEFGSSTESIKLNDIAKKHDLSIIFTVYEDGVRITDKALIEQLGYDVKASPEGNSGTVTLTEDGRIIFAPNAAKATGEKQFDVAVTCVAAGARAEKSYRVLAPVYTVKAEFGSSTQSIKINDITTPHDLSIIFTVYEDGVRITDKAVIEQLGYDVKASPEGNNGTVTLTEDGRIIFAPNTAKDSGEKQFDVTVTCIAAGAKTEKSYRVLIPSYTVKAEFGSGTQSVKLSDIEKQHGLSIVFSVYEDGIRITDKAMIEKLGYDVKASPEGNDGTVTLTEDGKIVFIPNQAKAEGDSDFDVTVTCNAAGDQISLSYRVLIPVYRVEAEWVGGGKDIHFDNIKNHGCYILFTVYVDGVQITEKSVIESVGEKFTVSEEGSTGEIMYTDDGKILFAPNGAWGKTGVGSYEVRVVCSIGNVSASETYRIVLPDIRIYAVPPETPIARNEFFGNTKYIAFYVEKDGRRMTKADLTSYDAQILNEKYAHLLRTVEITEDGTVICTPYSETERKVNPFNWLFNHGIWYLTLANEDMTVRFDSNFGSTEGVIPVGEAPLKYLIFMVGLSLFCLVFLILWIMHWFHCMIFKPRFPKTRTLYVGRISYDDVSGCHDVYSFSAYPLDQYNTLGYILKPTHKPKKITLNGGITFKAVKKRVKRNAVQSDRMIACYKGSVTPRDPSLGGEPWTANSIQKYVRSEGSLTVVKMSGDVVYGDGKGLVYSASQTGCYIIPTSMDNETGNILDAIIVYYV